ncbi:FxsA family protein [Gorillibacterium timonense]|uniref:FxsA family protein n=1 Tax=Gorillibacterium timonense TaxID=1689269 RepID=UPI00071DC0F0|nr:FxsA family protein [Gorillibacterium timonense]
MLRTLTIFLIVVPAVEVWGLVTASRWFGGWQTLLLLLLMAIAGIYIAKREGSFVWRELSADLSQGRIPADKLLDGLCVVIGGILLVVPGFLTDLIGLILLLPLTRPLAKRLFLRILQDQIRKGRIKFDR